MAQLEVENERLRKQIDQSGRKQDGDLNKMALTPWRGSLALHRGVAVRGLSLALK